MGLFGQQARRKQKQNRPRPVAKHPKAPKGGGGGGLLNPSLLLSGRKLGRAANKLTSLELTPAINAYGRQVTDLQTQGAGQALGLQQLGQRTGAAVGSAYDSLNASAGQNNLRQQAIANTLNQQTGQIAQQQQQAVTNSQQGELGGLTAALKSGNVDPGGSASQAALANQVQAQQQAAAQRAQGYQQFASAQGGALTGMGNALTASAQMRGREAQSSIAQAIADRIAQSNADSASAIREAQGKQADTQALWGASRIKNLLQLRGSERQQLDALASQAGLNSRAQLSANTSIANNLRTTGTSRANNAASNATSRHNTGARGRQAKKHDKRNPSGKGSSKSRPGG